MKELIKFASMLAHDFRKGCSSRQPQIDPTNEKEVDLCIAPADCRFKKGVYYLNTAGTPVKKDIDLYLKKGVYPFCTIDDFVRLGPFAIPVPKNRKQQNLTEDGDY